MRDTVTTSWSADDIGFLILKYILLVRHLGFVFFSTLPVLACYISKADLRKICIKLTHKIWRGIGMTGLNKSMPKNLFLLITYIN